MADNVTANSGSGGAVFATDDIGSVHYPIGKIAFGALDTATLVSATNPMPVAPAGAAAHDAAVSGNPTRIAGRATSATLAAVAAGDTNDLVTDLNGKLVTMPYGVPEVTVSGCTAAIVDTTDTTIIASPGSGIRNYITSVLVTNSHATEGVLVELMSADTVLYRGYAAALGGGFALTFPKPLRCAANEAFDVQLAAADGNVYVSAVGYTAP